MGEWEYRCFGCGQKHVAGLWYYRQGARDVEHWIQRICGAQYDELPQAEKDTWRLLEPGESI